MPNSSEDNSLTSQLLSLHEDKPKTLVVDVQGTVKNLEVLPSQTLEEPPQVEPLARLKQTIKQLLIASYDVDPLRLSKSSMAPLNSIGRTHPVLNAPERPEPSRPAAQQPPAETPPTEVPKPLPTVPHEVTQPPPKPVEQRPPERQSNSDYQAIIEMNLNVLEHHPDRNRLKQGTIPLEEKLVITVLENTKRALAELLRKHKTLTSYEASGRLVLSPLSKEFEYKGRKVRSREIKEINIIEGDNFGRAILDEDRSYVPGEIDFHTHVITSEDPVALDDHITIADLKAMLESAPWFDPDSRELQSRFRVHAIVSIMAEKKMLSLGRSGRAIFSFYIMDLDSQSARAGQPPFGLSKLPKTVVIDF